MTNRTLYKTLKSRTGELLLVQLIESVNFEKSGSDADDIINKLSDKKILTVRMQSGVEHIIFLDDLISEHSPYEKVKDDIITSWIRYAHRT